MKKTIIYLGLTLLVVAIIVAAGGTYLFYHYGRGLPDHKQLAAYEPATVTRVHAGDGRLLAEYAVEKRVFVPLSAIPQMLINAFLAAEDKNFYDHVGVDPISVAGALITNISNLNSDKRMVGASTITQQVAKNFLLTNEVSMSRKVKEAILALRIENAFSKDEILELYLNEIYLGIGSYGVAAAALNYFNKSLDELTLSEMAYLAALPKAPNNYHPVRKYDAAVSRRDWVILQMLENGFVSQAQSDRAKLEPLEMQKRDPTQFVEAEYFAEEVRRQLYEMYGEQGLYKGGLSVHTTVDPTLQAYADQALREGLAAYDQRHGWRGPLARITPEEDWRRWLGAFTPPTGAAGWQVAVVLALADQAASISFVDGATGTISLDAVSWARPQLEDRALGPKVVAMGDVLAPGDVVLVEAIREAIGEAIGEGENGTAPSGNFALKQIPDVGGALIVMNPHNGRVLAISGGFDYSESQFNRATQAKRQPGSAFKPFVYLAALDAGYTPASVVLDAPFVLDQGEGLGKWKPENYSQKFYGPSTLRLGLEKSRNLMTVRVAQAVGFGEIAGYAKRFGINPDLPPLASMALGAGETTLIRMASAYGMLVNGGHYIDPAFVERVQDRHGRTIFRRDTRACDSCAAPAWTEVPPPQLPDERAIVADPRTAYQVVSMLEGVVQRGTGRSLRDLGKPIGGKTGTTNDFNDAWFIGFTPDLVVGTYVGFDQPTSLGKRESGGRVAAPIVKAFFRDALADKTAVPFRVPPGIRFVRIDALTGLPAKAGNDGSIVEAFLPGTEPTAPARAALQADSIQVDTVPLEGVGGLY